VGGLNESVDGVDRYRMCVGGQWTAGHATGEIEVESPAAEAIIATILNGTAEDAEAALHAQPAWAALPPIERGQLVRKLADLVARDKHRLARVVVAEQGKPLNQAEVEIDAVHTFLASAAEQARRIGGDILPSGRPNEEIWIRRVLRGVVVTAAFPHITNCGQICTYNERMCLHRGIADRFLARFVDRVKAITFGDPMTDPDVGLRVNLPEVEKVEAMIDEATAGGAKVLTGGRRLREGASPKGTGPSRRSWPASRAQRPSYGTKSSGRSCPWWRSRASRRPSPRPTTPSTASRPTSSPATRGV